MSQLHNREVVRPMDMKELMHKQIRKTIVSLKFLKQKRDDAIKGRACVDD